MAAWLENYLDERILNEFLTIIGGKKDMEDLLTVGAQKQNIVQLVEKTKQFKLESLPRDYIPFLIDFVNDETKEIEGPSKISQDKKDLAQPSFSPRENLLSQSFKFDAEIIYAYKYPSTPGIASYHEN